MLIVIVGPTASGKSALSVRLAKKFGGEIISADSRQVYKGLNIGTGKITQKEMMGIPHHLLDVASPKKRFTVSQYQKLARKAIEDIQKRNNVPFLVGGSPLYIYAVADGWVLPEVPPNPKLREKLEKLTATELFLRLKKLDPKRTSTIEQKNKRRLIRALEIVFTTGKPVPPLVKNNITTIPWYGSDVLFIGVKRSSQELKKRIRKRITAMFKQGLVQEVRKLRSSGLSWQRIEELGFEYRLVASYLREVQKVPTLATLARVGTLQEELKAKIEKATEDFARRQKTWFKKDQRIHWIKTSNEAEKTVLKFVK